VDPGGGAIRALLGALGFQRAVTLYLVSILLGTCWAHRFEIRTAAGASTTEQCVFSGGPYTVESHVRHVQVVWPAQA
jgi:hypothetical protein